MEIYLKWSLPFIFSNRELNIFDLEIFQQENNFAKARLLIDVLSPLPPMGTEGILYEGKNEILFKGLLINPPLQSKNNFAELELIARPRKFLEASVSLQKEKRIHPFWDALWVKQSKHQDFQELQSIQTASPYCDRRTGKLAWSDWFKGKTTLHVGNMFFFESLSTKIMRAPLSACTIKVHAHWIQTENGISNLGPSIARAFPLHKVSTYTKNSLPSKWPGQGKKLGGSGIWVLKSELKQVIPMSSLYPRFSNSLLLASPKESSKPYRLERHWFKPKLWVRWQARQRRKETLSITLTHACQKLSPEEDHHKIVEFTLQHINPDPGVYGWEPAIYYHQGIKTCFKNGIYQCNKNHTSSLTFEEDQECWTFKKAFHTPLGNPARTSFFLTDRGYGAAEHAMERAKVELAKSARAFEVSFEGPWDILKKVTTDMSLSLLDPRLPGGKAKGKVVNYALVAKGETGERFVRVTLICTLKRKKVKSEDLKALPTYAEEKYSVPLYQIHHNRLQRTPTGLQYYRYDEATPLEMTPTGPLLRGVELINGPDEQIEDLRLHQTSARLKKALSQKSTRLKLFFKDLRTKERLEHVIFARMAGAWSA